MTWGGRGCITDVTKAFEAGKVKPIFLSALFSKASPTTAATSRLMASEVGLFPADRPVLSAPAMSTGSDYCLPDPDNVCH